MTDLVSALDSISLVRPKLRTEKILQARGWIADRQDGTGLFGGHLLRDRFHDLRLWFSLAVCRVFWRMDGTI